LDIGRGFQAKPQPQWLGRTVVTVEPLAIIANHGAAACVCLDLVSHFGNGGEGAQTQEK